MLNLALVAADVVAFSAQKQGPMTDDGIADQVRIKLANDPIVKGGALEVDCNAA